MGRIGIHQTAIVNKATAHWAFLHGHVDKMTLGTLETWWLFSKVRIIIRVVLGDFRLRPPAPLAPPYGRRVIIGGHVPPLISCVLGGAGVEEEVALFQDTYEICRE